MAQSVGEARPGYSDAPPAPEGGRPDSVGILTGAAFAVHAHRDRHRAQAWVLHSALAATGAPAAGLWLRDEGAGEWRVAGDGGARLIGLGHPRAYPSLRPAVDGARVVLLDVAAGLPPDERLRTVLPGASVLAVPVRAGGGSVHGLLVVAGGTPGPFDERAEAVVVALAAHLGVALDNLADLSRMSDREANQRSVFRQLQEAVFTPAPTVPHTELGMHYVASEDTAPTGGDLYDWVVLPDGSLHIAVIDIMGKGVAATKDALTVTHALRLLVFDGCSLDQLVARADRLACAQNPDLVATLVVGRYEPETGRLRLVGGGHPPALLVSGTTVTELSAPGIPLGWPGAGSFTVAETTLDRSDTVVLYTDGLVETTKDIVEGIAALKRYACETVGYPAPNLARALVDRALKGAARRDDSLALVLRRRTPPPLAGRHLLGPFEHRFSPNAASVPLARHLLDDWLVRLPVEGPATDDLLLVASELCSNAVRHSTGVPASVVLRAWADGADVCIEVEDDGGSLHLPEHMDELPDPDAEQGRGLFLVHALADELSSESVSGHTSVRVLKRAVISGS